MVGVAIGAAIAGVGAAYAGKQQKKAVQKQSDTALAIAAQEQAAQTKLLDQQRVEAQKTRDAMAAAETLRQNQEAERLNQAALSDQNTQLSSLTPTVEVTTDGTEGNSAASARKRRAQFQPAYTSGVTI